MSDNPLSKITPLKMGGYAIWVRDVNSYLLTKKWSRIALGKKKKPVVTTPADPDAPSSAEITIIARQKDALEKWIDDNGAAAGVIALMLSEEEKLEVQDYLSDGAALWAALKTRHLTVKPGSHYNTFVEFTSMRPEPGEELGAFFSRLKDLMNRIKQCREPGYTIDTLDKEMVSIAMIRALSDDKSCTNLVSNILGDETMLSDLDKLGTRLKAEDANRKVSPQLYGLKKSSLGVLVAESTPNAPTPTPAIAAAATTSKPKCTICNKPGHLAEVCRLKDKLKWTFCDKPGHKDANCFAKKEKALKDEIAELTRKSSDSAHHTAH